MVTRLVIGGRPLTEEEVLLRHQLLKLVQREKLKRSLNRTFTRGTFNFSAPLEQEQDSGSASNPLCDSSTKSHCRSGRDGSGGAASAAKAQAEVLQGSSKARKTSGSLLQLMKQSHGSLKQLLSKETMTEEEKSMLGKRSKSMSRSFQFQQALVPEELRKEDDILFILEKESRRFVTLLCTEDANLDSKPRKSGRLDLAPPRAVREAGVQKIDLVSLHNSPAHNGSTSFSPPNSIRTPFAEDNLQQPGIISSKNHSAVSQVEEESGFAEAEGCCSGKEVLLSNKLIISKQMVNSEPRQVDESASKTKSKRYVASTSKQAIFKCPFGAGSRLRSEHSSFGRPQVPPDNADNSGCAAPHHKMQKMVKSDRTKKQWITPKPPLKKFFTSTIMCRCAASIDGIS